MKRYVKIFVIMGCFLLLAGTANAQYLYSAAVHYDARYYSEFVHGEGPEAYSGSYTYILATVDGYDEIRNIRIRARHEPTGFTVSLLEADPSCIGVTPRSNYDQAFYIHIRASNRWVGDWEFTMRYRDSEGRRREETKTVTVPRFSYPPPPTGIAIVEDGGNTYLVWNSIGDPGEYPGEHIRYTIAHFTLPHYCIDEWVVVPGDPFYLWPGNRIAVELPNNWNSGDLVRIENRIYDDPPEGRRRDRACMYFLLP